MLFGVISRNFHTIQGVLSLTTKGISGRFAPKSPRIALIPTQALIRHSSITSTSLGPTVRQGQVQVKLGINKTRQHVHRRHLREIVKGALTRARHRYLALCDDGNGA